MANKSIKLCMFNLGNLLEGKLSQILYLRLNFHLTFCIYLKFHFLDYYIEFDLGPK